MGSSEVDTSWKEDLSLGISNLISVEEHSAQSFITSEDDFWLKLINEVRIIRTYCMEVVLEQVPKDGKKLFITAGDLLGMYYTILEEKHEGRNQKWCCLKHLLSAYMRLTETANKFYEIENISKPENNSNFLEKIKKGYSLLKGG